MPHTHLDRRTALALLAGLGLSTAPGLKAQGSYPNRPLRIIVPVPPGGAGDTAIRLVGKALSEALGQPVIVDNKPGGDGVIAAQELIRSAPDGYSILFGAATQLIYTPLVHASKPPYDPLADFAPVSAFSSFTYFMHVHESVPARTMQEFIAYVKANPDKVAYGTGDSTSIVTMALILNQAGLEMTHVPYKGGGPAFIDFAAGRVQVMVGPLDLDARMQGKSRPLAVLQQKRSPLRPEIPSLPEIGLSKVNLQAWTGFFAPSKVPKPLIDQLSAIMVTTFRKPELVEAFARLGSNLEGSTPEALGAVVRGQIPVWREAIRLAKIPLE